MILTVPCLLGLESLVADEMRRLNLKEVRAENGRVHCSGGFADIARLNINLRCGARVLMELGSFPAPDFEALFQGVLALPWEEFIPADGRFWVAKASSVKSRLFSAKDIQSITKKAMVERMRQACHTSCFPEDGADYPLRLFLMKDEVMAAIDTTGESLHKRGYRPHVGKAPISETLAAALLMLTPWKGDRILVDPFCGSGTFPIEAAMMAANVAPGMNRSFTAESWTNLIEPKMWQEMVEEAQEMADLSIAADIQGYDIDGQVVRAARENARRAGVGQLIHFQQRPLSELRHPKKYGFLVGNPPYGERLEDRETLPGLYREIGEALGRLDSWSAYLITAYEDAQKYIGRKADKNRKIYNGMIKAYFYQFLGPKPPRPKTQPNAGSDGGKPLAGQGKAGAEGGKPIMGQGKAD